MANNNGYDRDADKHTLFRGETHLSSTDWPVSPAIQDINKSGYIVGPPAYPVPGHSALINGSGSYDVMLALNKAGQGSGGLTYAPMANPDGYIYRDTLYYRTDLTPQRDGQNYRLEPRSVTQVADRYRFMDGRTGDIYG